MEKPKKKRSTSRKRKQDEKIKELTETTENPQRREPTEEEIRRRAYEIYLARGGTGGYELEDWLQAERELRSQNN